LSCLKNGFLCPVWRTISLSWLKNGCICPDWRTVFVVLT
jgi:hypothetical protein